jgi:hypothetical protein
MVRRDCVTAMARSVGAECAQITGLLHLAWPVLRINDKHVQRFDRARDLVVESEYFLARGAYEAGTSLIDAKGQQFEVLAIRDGNLRKIEHIDVLGPWGTSMGRRLLSRLTDAWRIDVALSDPLPCSLEQIKRLLIDCMESPQSADSMQFEVPDARKQFLTAVLAASDAAELLGLLKLPEPEDALDVL